VIPGPTPGASPDEGHARRLATGSLVQQMSQITGLLAMLLILTVLARRLSLTELGVYGILSSLAGYLLVIQNAIALGGFVVAFWLYQKKFPKQLGPGESKPEATGGYK
jgi:hypothetical protein